MAHRAGYTLHEQLHSSHRSTLFRATRLRDHRPVILKLTTSDYLDRRRTLELRREYAIARRVEGNGILRVLGLEEFPDRAALVLEDFGGISLRHLLDERGPLDVGTFLDFAVRLGAALGHIHQRGVIHKDIKPHNIIVNPTTGELKITDFSLSVGLSLESVPPELPTHLTGTLAYMAPEQTGRMNRGVDSRADFYALGATFFELLTDRRLFITSSPLELLHAHVARVPPSPRELNPEVPERLAAIILKLLAKAPEERYQSTWGLIADLEQCQRQWREGSTLPPFPLGLADQPHQYRQPQGLHGRDADVALLTRTYARAAAGQGQLLLISGPAGIGKSSLVNELYRVTAASRGRVAMGKCDQLLNSEPFDAIHQALQALVRQTLGEGEAETALIRERLQEVLGSNLAALAEAVPDTRALVGEQPPPLPLSSSESRNRLNLVLTRTLQAFATPERPLALFLDDLQWADNATLTLLQSLARDVSSRHLLLIGTYRDTELSPEHPLTHARDALRATGTTWERIHLAPLGIKDVARMVCESTAVEAGHALELARLIHSRTGGNPFSVKTFLRFLHERELLRFDPRSRRWEWDVARIESQGLPEDIATLMVAESQRLPEEIRALLQSAAFLGVTFGFQDLLAAHGASAAETARALWTAIERRLVLPLGKDYVLLDPQGGAVEPLDLDVSFRFAHDRIRQAAYSLIPEEERAARHTEVGLRLYEDARATKTLDERMFTILPHLGHEPERIGPDTLRLELADLHLSAGRRAKSSGAYRTACELFRTGAGLIPAAREQEHERTFALHKELAESFYLTGDIEAAASSFSALLSQARTPAQRASVLCLQAILSSLNDRHAESLELGLEGLRLLGIDLPSAPDEATVAAELRRVETALEGRHIEALLDLPPMSEPTAQLAAELLSATVTASYFISQQLLVLLTLRQVRLSLEHGNSRFSPYGYAAYGFVVSTLRDDPATGRRFSLLAFELATRLKDPMQQARALYIHVAYLEQWTRSARAGIPQLAKAYKGLLESGDWLHAGHCSTFLSWQRLALGESLPDVLAENQRFLEQFAAQKDVTNLQMHRAFRRALLQLTGAPEEESSRESHPPHFGADAMAHITQVRLEQRYLFRQFEEALALAREGSVYMPFTLDAFLRTTHAFYYALSAAAVYPRASVEQRQELLAAMEQQRAWLEKCAQRAPENFSPYHVLFLAELARVKGQHVEAHTRYEEAIAAARSSGFTSVEAIACEQACRFQAERNRLPLASAYLVEALNAYERWGAAGKVHLLATEQSHLLRAYGASLRAWDHKLQQAGLPALPPTADLTSTDSLAEVLDISSVMKASQAISSELHFPQLAANLIDILMESTGAQRGVLVLQREEDFFVEASGEMGHGSAPLLPVERMAHSDALCHTIAELVLSTGTHLLLDDASSQEPFRAEPYVSRHHVRSVLCVPILHRKQLLGLVYLENNLTPGAFNSNRLKAVGMLLAQAAISLENAGLYRKLEKSHRTLEHRVQERTEQLHSKNAELEGALERLRTMQAQIITQEKLASLGSLTAGIAHELKNPLNFVKNFSELSLELMQELRESVDKREDTGSLLQELERNLAKVCEHEQRASGIINGMLRHARNTRGAPRATSINQLVEDAVRLVDHGQRARRPPRHVAFDVAFDTSVPPCHLVPEDLSRVILNLLDNGCYAAQQKAGRETDGQPRLKVSTRWTGSEVEIRVRDNGNGVPASVRDKLFTPFFTTKPTGEGTGLGLSLSHEIVVVALGGKLRVESEEGQYAEFTVVLPGELARPRTRS
ncbi:serine/threonine protein kinase [Archangium sp. Cb G35]|uniref:trifunctional serine/threonine-protein kinase/ATP-binding protein/sensor histidine kinase n=1 Tax=Archangium sp. Cb G35 TaxID=1920190 RepID=UPI000936EE80|nr:ATP-binding sensor histidine kinase [Archangium sp. Cb G35]OJT17915.1 serine/threonine protein kinase [Archangium sp. Cb G35]